jgi:hypothetical protein
MCLSDALGRFDGGVLIAIKETTHNVRSWIVTKQIAVIHRCLQGLWVLASPPG